MKKKKKIEFFFSPPNWDFFLEKESQIQIWVIFCEKKQQLKLGFDFFFWKKNSDLSFFFKKNSKFEGEKKV